jgi:hypothetical protein
VVRRDTPNQRRRTMPWEFTLGGSGNSNEDFDAGGAQATASVGYYFNEVVELSARQSSSYFDGTPSGDGSWASQSRVALDLHIPLQYVAPYGGVNWGYSYGDLVNDSMVAGPEAGVKFYLKDDVLLLAGVEWEFFFDKDDSLNAAFKDGQLIYVLSLGVRF